MITIERKMSLSGEWLYQVWPKNQQKPKITSSLLILAKIRRPRIHASSSAWPEPATWGAGRKWRSRLRLPAIGGKLAAEVALGTRKQFHVSQVYRHAFT